jgi:Rtf2 RING-finger
LEKITETKFPNLQKDKDAERVYRWKHCSLTQQRLQSPIVMCGLGRLYTKQNVIEALLDKEVQMPETASHIKSLKDIRDLNMTPNPAYSSEADQKDTIHDNRSAPFICALIGLEMSGKFRFIGLWTCGCVFSERALKEIKASACPVCQVSFTEQDVVILNGTEEDMDSMRVKLEMRTARLAAERKAKKDKKSKTASVTSTVVSEVNAETKKDDFVAPKPVEPAPQMKKKDGDVLKISPPPTAAASTSTAKIIGPSTSKPLSKVDKRAIICDKISDDPVYKKSKTDYSVAKDPKATEVYKSLFTTHNDEKNQDRAHWVTYNPFYN